MEKIVKTKKYTRNAEFASGDIDHEKRTVQLSFSSELPVERHFGDEILDHSPESVDMSRLQNGAPVLVDHAGDQIGVVETAEIAPDKRGYATLRFGNSQRAKDVFADIIDGIRKNVSFGYQIREMIEEVKGVFRAIDWLPFEISIVSTPADPTIGIGRDMDDSEIETVVQSADEPEQEIVEEVEQAQTIILVIED